MNDFKNVINKKNEYKKKIPLSDRNHLKNNIFFDNLFENRNFKNKNLMNIHKKDAQLFSIVMKKFHSYRNNKLIPGNDIINYKKIRYLSPNQRKITKKKQKMRRMATFQLIFLKLKKKEIFMIKQLKKNLEKQM